MSNRNEVIAFFAEFRHLVDGKAQGRTMIIDLARVRNLELPTALALVAEMDRWQRKQAIKLNPTTIENWHPEVVRQLVELGFFKLLRTDIHKDMKTVGRDHWIRFLTDTATVGSAARLLRQRIEAHLGGEAIAMGLEIYGSLVEAMKNAFQHAYPDGLLSPEQAARVGRRWWMTGRVDPEERSIRLVFLDQGITIPVSLPNSWIWGELSAQDRKLLNGDGARIAQAMTYGTSRLEGQHHRGKGFTDIRRPVFLDDRNYLQVMSRAGYFLQVGAVDVAQEMPERFAGTLIDWYLFLPQPA